MCLLAPVTIYHLHISGCCIILHYFSIHFTRVIFIEETNSLAHMLCTCKHEKRITLIMNKMLVAFAFRLLAVFMHAFLHK